MISWRLHQMMSERRCSNKLLAKALGVHPNTVARLQKTDRMPTINGDRLDTICETLRCSPSDLIIYEPNSSLKLNTSVHSQSSLLATLQRLEQEIQSLRQAMVLAKPEGLASPSR